jgi:carbonic anhydrase
MSWIEELLTSQPAASRDVADVPRRPRKRLSIVTCMDARIDPIGLFGLSLGDAQVLRNAGGRVTEDTVRSLALAVHLFGVDTVVLVEHSGCGLAETTNEQAQALTGTTIDFLPIEEYEVALASDVARVAAEPALRPLRRVAGLFFDIENGALSSTIAWERTD